MKKAPKEKQSPTHQIDHIKRVWKIAERLGKKLGADMEILVAAVFLHDIGRHYGYEFHGPKSAKYAKNVLERINFPKNKRNVVLRAIAAHDYQTPSKKRNSIEAKILYDADKFDVFGKIGIDRLTRYYLNRGSTPEEICEMLKKDGVD